MKRLGMGIFLFLILSAVGVNTFGVGKISFNVKITPDKRIISGTERFTFVPNGTRIYFLLLANLDREENPYLSARMLDQMYPYGFEPSLTTVEEVDMVQSGSTTALPFKLLSLPPEFQTYSLNETVLAVDIPKGEDTVTLQLRFSTTVPRRSGPDQVDNDGVITWRFGWAPLPVLPQEMWGEKHGVLVYNGKGSPPLLIPALYYSGTISIPDSYTLICGADTSTVKTISDEKIYKLTNETPTRTLAFALGKEYKKFSLPAGTVMIEVNYLPGHDEEARLFATYARDILQEYESRFGAYPRKRLVLVEDPNRDGTSMAADGIIFISSFYFTHRNVTLPGILNRLDDFILAHEIAHQWWGIGVGVDMNAENWLSEGLAQYAAVSYFEKKYGATGPNLFPDFGKGIVENYIKSQFGFLNLREHQIELPYLLNLEDGFDEALVKPLSAVQYENASVVRIYDKGYLVMRNIEAYLGGQKNFDTALRTAAAQLMHRRMSVAEFEKILEKSSSKDLSTLFNAWVYGEDTVDYAVDIISQQRTDDGKYKTEVEVSRDGGIPQPVVVQATLRDGKTVQKTWNGQSSRSTLTFTTEEPVLRVTIDPDHFTLDRDRLDNNSPVKFVVAMKKNAFPLDAYLIHPDPVSQGVTISYLDRMRIHIDHESADAQIAIGRSHYVSLSAKLEKNDLDAAASYTYLSFSQLEDGSPGTYWAPTLSFTIGARRKVTDDGPISYLYLRLFSPSTICYSRESALALDVTPSGAGRMMVGAFDELRILPQIYLQGTMLLGTSFGTLPQPLMFDRSEIHTFGRADNGKFVPLHSYGMHMLYGRLDVELPLQDDSPYNLFNLAMVDHAVMRIFGAIGHTWNNDAEFDKTVPNAEAGVEVIANVSAIGGLLPMKVGIGYATPLLGEGTSVIYMGFSL